MTENELYEDKLEPEMSEWLREGFDANDCSKTNGLFPCPCCGKQPDEAQLGSWANNEKIYSCNCNDMPALSRDEWNNLSPLKDCPFCNKEMSIKTSLRTDDPTIVICWQCGTETELTEWNKRPIEDELQKRVDERTKLADGYKKLMLLIDRQKMELVHECDDFLSRLRDCEKEIDNTVIPWLGLDSYASLAGVQSREIKRIFNNHFPELAAHLDNDISTGVNDE